MDPPGPEWTPCNWDFLRLSHLLGRSPWEEAPRVKVSGTILFQDCLPRPSHLPGHLKSETVFTENNEHHLSLDGPSGARMDTRAWEKCPGKCLSGVALAWDDIPRIITLPALRTKFPDITLSQDY